MSDQRPMTLAEKILAARSDRESVRPGEIVFARLDLVMSTDVTTPLSVKVFEEMGAGRVFDPAKLALVNDHFVPAKDIAAADLSAAMRSFAREQKIEHYYEVGFSGVCHIVIPEEGLVKPGDLVVGADSHTCTYGALGAFATGVGSTDLSAAWALGESWFKVPPTIRLEFDGVPGKYVCGKDLILHAIGDLGVDGAVYKALEIGGATVEAFCMADRLTMCNMAIEAGAKAGLIPADEITFDYLGIDADERKNAPAPDSDAEYEERRLYDASSIPPLVAEPYLPSLVKPAAEVAGTGVDQVVIGSCTNGRIEDFRTTVEVLAGERVHPTVRLLVLPGSQKVLSEMLAENLVDKLVAAGATICPPTCGPCIGGHMGVLAAGETGLYTTNRNFVGRNGHIESRVYLSGPAVAAASAVTGEITCPAEV